MATINRAELAFKKINELDKDVLITFQDERFSQLSNISNYKNIKSYDWLHERIGYYPIWTIKITEYYRNNFKEFERILSATCSNDRRYLYILEDDNKNIDTYLYAWVDVHSIENNGYDDDDDKEAQASYNRDWKNHLCNEVYFEDPTIEIQTLVEEIKANQILHIL